MVSALNVGARRSKVKLQQVAITRPSNAKRATRALVTNLAKFRLPWAHSV